MKKSKTKRAPNSKRMSELSRLKEELREARETLLAIQNGEVDALVVSGGGVDKIFTLKSADQPYRVLVETMTEGAVTIGQNGTILYCNQCFASLVGFPLEKTIGASIKTFISNRDLRTFDLMFEVARRDRCKGEIGLKLDANKFRATLFSMCAVQLENERGVSLIVTDISEQRKLAKSKVEMERLKIMHHKVQFALAARDEFLSIASHELKTPITSLKLQLAMVARKINVPENRAPTPEKLAHVFDISLKQLERLTNLVEDLLDVSKIQAGRVQYQFEEFNLRNLLLEISDRLEDQLVAAENRISIEVAENLVGVWDRSRLEQVFVNLLSNAMKYAPGSELIITASNVNGRVSVGVMDRGPGIPAAKLPLIFNRFERATSSRNISGLGLGLYIVKQIIEAHGGAISVASEVGRGTTFLLQLPINAGLGISVLEGSAVNA